MTYIDEALQFGHRSAPKIFSAVADVIAWVLFSRGIQHQLHYLDDILFMEASNLGSSSTVRLTALETQGQLGIPVATNKTEGPTSVLTFLGILINSHTFEPPKNFSRHSNSNE